MKKIHIVVCVLLIVAAAIATLMYYSNLPESIPVHWNLDGMPDKYGPRAMLYLLGPGLMSMMLTLGLCMPWFSPKRFGLESFKATYSYFIVVLVGMFGLFYAVVLHAILTDSLEIQRTIYVGVFMLLILVGNPMGKVKRNFYVGIKTPWTLASERVWYATHRLSARVMVASGLLGLIAVFVGASTWILLVLASSWVAIVTVFSLVCYKRLDALNQD
ncbi:SdpI family protein [Serratia fonticola]|uniref:SdpI family protein n=1 Tax=Serratia fonticola TaxID=47917 RepID=UPI00192B3377|nr:SdpI family protein [Serratia fonticola]MBL5862149.1 SdpI family protein [Serratia fonticola]